jgi:hypothetical protein
VPARNVCYEALAENDWALVVLHAATRQRGCETVRGRGKIKRQIGRGECKNQRVRPMKCLEGRAFGKNGRNNWMCSGGTMATRSNRQQRCAPQGNEKQENPPRRSRLNIEAVAIAAAGAVNGANARE